MTARQTEALGVLLIIAGSIWFCLSMIWLPPLVMFFGLFRLPDAFFKILIRCDFIIPVFIVATGLILKRRSHQTVSRKAYVVAYGCATIVSAAALAFWGFLSASG